MTISVAALVTNAHSHHLGAFEQEFYRRKFGIDFNLISFAKFRHPNNQFSQRCHLVAVILKRWGRDWRAESILGRQEIESIVAYRTIIGGLLVGQSLQEFIKSPGIDNGSAQDVRSDPLAFFDHQNRQRVQRRAVSSAGGNVSSVVSVEPGQVEGSGQTSRARSNEQHIDLDFVSIHGNLPYRLRPH